MYNIQRWIYYSAFSFDIWLLSGHQQSKSFYLTHCSLKNHTTWQNIVLILIYWGVLGISMYDVFHLKWHTFSFYWSYTPLGFSLCLTLDTWIYLLFTCCFGVYHIILCFSFDWYQWNLSSQNWFITFQFLFLLTKPNL